MPENFVRLLEKYILAIYALASNGIIQNFFNNISIVQIKETNSNKSTHQKYMLYNYKSVLDKIFNYIDLNNYKWDKLMQKKLNNAKELLYSLIKD